MSVYDEDLLPTCYYDGTCYYVKIFPTIDSISHDTGYSAGGQNLTITGKSLDGDLDITVDGAPCTIMEIIGTTEVIC